MPREKIEPQPPSQAERSQELEISEESQELQTAREAYINAYRQYQEAFKKPWYSRLREILTKTGREERRRRRSIEQKIESLRSNIQVGDSQKLEQGVEEAQKRRENFIEGLKQEGFSQKEAEAIYEVESKKMEYEEVKIGVGRELFKKKKGEFMQQGKGEEEAEQLALAYVFQELVVKEKETLLKAQIESWPPKEKGIFRKALDWYLRLGTGTRLLISTGLVTGIVAASGGFSAPAIALFAGYRFLRGLSVVALSKGVHHILGGILNKYWIRAREESALKKLREEFSLDKLREVEEEYQKVLEETAGRKRTATILKAAATMAVVGLALWSTAEASPLSHHVSSESHGMQPPVRPAEAPGIQPSVQPAETPGVQPAETPGVQPAGASEVPHSVGEATQTPSQPTSQSSFSETGQTGEIRTTPGGETARETFTAPSAEISPPAPGTPIKWSFPGLEEMKGKWIDNNTVEIAGTKYYGVIREGGKFYIKVGVDTNYDGLADPGKKVLIDVETGRGVFEGKTVYAFDKGERFELVARSHAMVDVNRDGQVESAFWIDNKGVCHLSHDLNPKGLEIEGQSYNDWYNSNIANKTPDELQRLNIFDLKVEFKNFVPHDNVNLNDPKAVAKDLARQIAAVESSNYHLGEKGALILEEKRFKISQEVIAEELGKKFQSDHSFFEKVRDNGLALEEWQKLRPEINKAVENRLLSITTQLEEKIPSERKIISGVEQAKTHLRLEEKLPIIRLEEGTTHIPYNEGELFAVREGHKVTLYFKNEVIGKGMVREDGTYYIVGNNLDPEKVRAFNSARLNLERAAEGKEMIPDILQALGREDISKVGIGKGVDIVVEGKISQTPETHFETSSLKPEISGLSPETRNYLEILIAEEKDISAKVSELLERVRSGKLTVEQFSRYYAFKLGVREFSPEMISNLNNNFEMAIRGTGEEKLRALRALEIILIRLSLEEK
jgi:hypothetical protein